MPVALSHPPPTVGPLVDRLGRAAAAVASPGCLPGCGVLAGAQHRHPTPAQISSNPPEQLPGRGHHDVRVLVSPPGPSAECLQGTPFRNPRTSSPESVFPPSSQTPGLLRNRGQSPLPWGHEKSMASRGARVQSQLCLRFFSRSLFLASHGHYSPRSARACARAFWSLRVLVHKAHGFASAQPAPRKG